MVDKSSALTTIFQNVYEDDPICFLNSSSHQPIGLRSLLTLGYCNGITVDDDPVRTRCDIYPPTSLKYSSERDCNELLTQDGRLRLDRILPILNKKPGPSSHHFFMASVQFAAWGMEYFNKHNASIATPEYDIVAALPYNHAYAMVDGAMHELFHVNFLTRRIKNKTSPYPEIDLFFAELWGDNMFQPGYSVRRCQLLKPCLSNSIIGGVTTYSKGGIFHPLEVPCSTCSRQLYPLIESSAISPVF